MSDITNKGFLQLRDIEYSSEKSIRTIRLENEADSGRNGITLDGENITISFDHPMHFKNVEIKKITKPTENPGDILVDGIRSV